MKARSFNAHIVNSEQLRKESSKHTLNQFIQLFLKANNIHLVHDWFFVFDFGFYTLILYIVEKHLQLFVKQEQVHVSLMVMVSVPGYLVLSAADQVYWGLPRCGARAGTKELTMSL